MPVAVKSNAGDQVQAGNRPATLQRPVQIAGFTPAGVLALAGVSAPSYATGTLTSDNTNVANGETVRIGNDTYTFKTTLTPAAYEVLRGASADASLTNLSSAVNHTGTPGTDYASATPRNSSVSASAVSSHTIVVTALQPGSYQNKLVTTEGSAHLSWGAATLTGGAEGAIAISSFGSGSGVTAAPVLLGSDDSVEIPAGAKGWTVSVIAGTASIGGAGPLPAGFSDSDPNLLNSSLNVTTNIGGSAYVRWNT